MKNYKESSKKSYHELLEETDDKKGFSRADLPRKRKELTKSDDEPMISMAKSESYQKRGYDDQDRKPYPPRNPGEYKKPYTPREGEERKPYPPRDGQGFKKPYDPNRSSEFKKPYEGNKPFNKPFKKSNGDR